MQHHSDLWLNLFGVELLIYIVLDICINRSKRDK
ncbi:hypothetical protein J9874_03552 (plasmid) [Duffyella gerundensis]|nr:hypothetical protein J9874_03552 [Duffyella gerundensis]